MQLAKQCGAMAPSLRWSRQGAATVGAIYDGPTLKWRCAARDGRKDLVQHALFIGLAHEADGCKCQPGDLICPAGLRRIRAMYPKGWQ